MNNKDFFLNTNGNSNQLNNSTKQTQEQKKKVYVNLCVQSY